MGQRLDASSHPTRLAHSEVKTKRVCHRYDGVVLMFLSACFCTNSSIIATSRCAKQAPFFNCSMHRDKITTCRFPHDFISVDNTPLSNTPTLYNTTTWSVSLAISSFAPSSDLGLDFSFALGAVAGTLP